MDAKTVETAVYDYTKALLEQPEPYGLYRAALEPLERGMLTAVMAHTGNNQTQAAQLLGMNRATLRTKLNRLRMPFSGSGRCIRRANL